MNAPQNTADLIEKLKQVQSAVVQTVSALSESQFNAGTLESWSAADYLKHLILSVKPLAKALTLPAEQMQMMFGQPENSSHSYEEVVAGYKAKLAEGFRAEDANAILPVDYRFPEGVEDKQAYLIQTWDESNNRLFAALQNWAEADLDTHQLPHPAVGMLTLREMLFFTLHHNTMHWHDIETAGAAK